MVIVSGLQALFLLVYGRGADPGPCLPDRARLKISCQARASKRGDFDHTTGLGWMFPNVE